MAILLSKVPTNLDEATEALITLQERVKFYPRLAREDAESVMNLVIARTGIGVWPTTPESEARFEAAAKAIGII